MNGGRDSKTANLPERYRVADLLVDAGRQCVMRGEAEIPLPKLSFDLLLALVRAAPNVLSHDELMSQVWPRLVVSPETLSQRVKLLRDALGDEPREPRYVAALRGRGYRLLPDVEPLEEPVVSVPPTAVPPHAAPRLPAILHTRRRLALAAITALAVVGIAILLGRTIREPPPTETGAQGTVTVAALPSRTVAVMPFKHLSPDPQDEFVALGIAEGVLHRLAGIGVLTVIARTSSFAVGGQHTDAREIGLTLNARYLVEGSVQRAGDRLRVTAQLIDATDGTHVWSLRFDRTMGDVFAMEDEIARSVAEALHVSVGAPRHPFARFGTDAYLAFMQGRALMATRKRADAELAIERFSRALELAPQSAAAHAALAEAYISHAMLTAPERTPVEDREHLAAVQTTAESLLTRALELDATLGEAYVWRAWIRMGRGDTTAAVADYEKGIALSPNYAPGLQSYAEELHRLGRSAEAVVLVDRARRIDPLYPRSHYFKGMMMLGAGSLEEAEALFLQTLRVEPDFHPALMRLGIIRWFNGQLAEAVKYAERALAVDPDAAWVRHRLSTLYLDLDDPDAARHVLAESDALPQAWVPICLYTYDLEGIRRLLQGSMGPDALAHDGYLVSFITRAVRDQALASGRLETANALMQAVAERWDPTAGNAEIREDFFVASQLDQILVAAQWRKSVDERHSAEASARAVLQRSDLDAEKSLHPAAQYTRWRGLALAILGQNEAAFTALDSALASNYMHRWWYDVDREPAFAALRDDPRFEILAMKVRAHIAAQRQLLERMRADGEVPPRSMGANSGPC